MSIKVDIANQVRQTTVLAWRPLLPLFEAVMNSFQAIKEAGPPPNISGRVLIEVVRDPRQLDLDIPTISGFRVTDNGIGLDDNNFDSFNTAFSAHKLTRGGKGLGRFTWLKAFDSARIESTFKDENGFYTRSFMFDENYDLEDKRGLPKPSSRTQTGTTVELVELKPLYRHECPRSGDILAMIFVVADLTPRLKEILEDFSATMTPDKLGYYGYHPNYRVYYEVMDYGKMLSDAVKRNRIFFDKLNLVDNR